MFYYGLQASSCRLPVPHLRPLWFAFQPEGIPVFFLYAFNVVTHQNAGAAIFTQGYRAFGIPAKSEAGGAEHAAFFL